MNYVEEIHNMNMTDSDPFAFAMCATVLPCETRSVQSVPCD